MVNPHRVQIDLIDRIKSAKKIEIDNDTVKIDWKVFPLSKLKKDELLEIAEYFRFRSCHGEEGDKDEDVMYRLINMADPKSIPHSMREKKCKCTLCSGKKKNELKQYLFVMIFTLLFVSLFFFFLWTLGL